MVAILKIDCSFPATKPWPQLNYFFIFFQPEGSFAKSSETLTQYEDKKARRPVIHRLRDHSEEVQPRGAMNKR